MLGRTNTPRRWQFAAGRADTPRAVLRRAALEDAIVPSLWRPEVANVPRNAVRGRTCTLGDAERCLARLQIAVDSGTDAHPWGRARTLSLAHDLTVYAAANLELALRRGKALASCNMALIDAGRREGIHVLDA